MFQMGFQGYIKPMVKNVTSLRKEIFKHYYFVCLNSWYSVI